MSVTRNYPLPTATEDFPWPSGNEPWFDLETRYGTVKMKAVRATHVMVSAGIPLNEMDAQDRAVTIRGIKYAVQAALHKEDDHVTPPGSGWRTVYSDPSLTRFDDWSKSGSASATQAMREELVRAVTEWAESHPEALASAERRYRAESAHHLARQLDELTEQRQRIIDALDACLSGEDFKVYPNA